MVCTQFTDQTTSSFTLLPIGHAGEVGGKRLVFTLVQHLLNIWVDADCVLFNVCVTYNELV